MASISLWTLLLLFAILRHPEMESSDQQQKMSKVVFTMNSTKYECSGVTDTQLIFFNQLSFWIGGIFHLVISIIGFISNAISIPALKSKILFKSTFNRLLIILSVCDNIYLILAMLESIRQEIGSISLQLHIVIFVYFLYPLHNIVLCLSILMTVVLAMERFRSISDPIDYHAIIVGGRQWQRVFRYVAPVIVLSVAFNVPKFFELQVDYYPTSEAPNATLKVRSNKFGLYPKKSQVPPHSHCLKITQNVAFYFF